MFFLQTTQYTNFAANKYPMTITPGSGCGDIKGANFNAVLKGGEGVDIFIYNKEDVFGVVQVRSIQPLH